MFGIIAFFLILIAFVLIIASIPVSISVIAYLSRKSKRKKIFETLPKDVSYTASVRLNTAKKNDAVVKLKAFEFSGVLYLKDNIVYVEGTKGQKFEFDLKDSVITWPGIQVQNGAMQWFCIDNMKGQKLYVNAETGVFVFRLSSKMPSTRDIYQYLLAQQQITAIGN
ncbi:MAG: hypothetical protein ACLVKO_02565 [Dysgonomonas sp.]